MDYGDKAAMIEIKARNMSLDAMKQRAARKILNGGSLNCMECGDLIPAARRKAAPNCEYCITCQQKLEEGL